MRSIHGPSHLTHKAARMLAMSGRLDGGGSELLLQSVAAARTCLRARVVAVKGGLNEDCRTLAPLDAQHGAPRPSHHAVECRLDERGCLSLGPLAGHGNHVRCLPCLRNLHPLELREQFLQLVLSSSNFERVHSWCFFFRRCWRLAEPPAWRRASTSLQ